MVPTELVVEALEKKQKNSLDKNVNGGKGSGNFGHKGRPGLVGGSSDSQTTTDSNGNELSPEQQAYFKDSKIRDENGNLLTVYHGIISGGYPISWAG